MHPTRARATRAPSQVIETSGGRTSRRAETGSGWGRTLERRNSFLMVFKRSKIIAWLLSSLRTSDAPRSSSPSPAKPQSRSIAGSDHQKQPASPHRQEQINSCDHTKPPGTDGSRVRDVFERMRSEESPSAKMSHIDVQGLNVRTLQDANLLCSQCRRPLVDSETIERVHTVEDWACCSRCALLDSLDETVCYSCGSRMPRRDASILFVIVLDRICIICSPSCPIGPDSACITCERSLREPNLRERMYTSAGPACCLPCGLMASDGRW
jgi:hypothetical protein